MKFKLRTTANDNESIAASPINSFRLWAIKDLRLFVTYLFYGFIDRAECSDGPDRVS